MFWKYTSNSVAQLYHRPNIVTRSIHSIIQDPGTKHFNYSTFAASFVRLSSGCYLIMIISSVLKQQIKLFDGWDRAKYLPSSIKHKIFTKYD